MMKQSFLKLAGALTCSFGILMTMASGAMMSSQAADAEGSLTLICQKDDFKLEGLEWDLYRVGSRDGERFVLEGEFSEYPVVIDDFSESAMNASAKTLENFAVLDHIPPIANGLTDANGVLVFDGLEEGLYLVSGHILHVDNTVYVPSTMLFEINSSDASLDWDAYPKFVYRTMSSQEIQFTVKKVWLNEDDEPYDATTSITVEIFRDRELYERVVLNEENNWTYQWKGLDRYEWRVREVEIPEGFTVAYESNETQYLIINTFHGITTTDIVTTTSTTETTTTTTDTTLVTTATSDERLPQTGQLWWPVIVLGLAGVILVAIGCRLMTVRNGEQESK